MGNVSELLSIVKILHQMLEPLLQRGGNRGGIHDGVWSFDCEAKVTPTLLPSPSPSPPPPLPPLPPPPPPVPTTTTGAQHSSLHQVV